MKKRPALNKETLKKLKAPSSIGSLRILKNLKVLRNVKCLKLLKLLEFEGGGGVLLIRTFCCFLAGYFEVFSIFKPLVLRHRRVVLLSLGIKMLQMKTWMGLKTSRGHLLEVRCSNEL